MGPTHYDVGGLVPGTYRLEFDALDSFETPTGGGLTEVAHEFWNDQPSLELAQDVVVTSAGQVLEGYDAVLVRDQYPNEVENVTAPAITGNPVVGQTLTAIAGHLEPRRHDVPLPVVRGVDARRRRTPRRTRRPRPTSARRSP